MSTNPVDYEYEACGFRIGNPEAFVQEYYGFRVNDSLYMLWLSHNNFIIASLWESDAFA